MQVAFIRFGKIFNYEKVETFKKSTIHKCILIKIGLKNNLVLIMREKILNNFVVIMLLIILMITGLLRRGFF